MKTSWIAGVLLLAGISAAGCQLGPGDYIAVRVGGGGGTLLIVAGTVTQGPMVPVAREDTINEAPIEGARVRIETLDGELVGHVVSDAEGGFTTQLAPGTYRFVPLPISDARWPLPPNPIETTIVRSRSDLSFSYDTGIR